MITEDASRIEYYPPEIVKEIILGPRIQKEDKSAIIELHKQKYSHAAVLEVKCDYSKGNLYLNEC